MLRTSTSASKFSATYVIFNSLLRKELTCFNMPNFAFQTEYLHMVMMVQISLVYTQLMVIKARTQRGWNDSVTVYTSKRKSLSMQEKMGTAVAWFSDIFQIQHKHTTNQLYHSLYVTIESPTKRFRYPKRLILNSWTLWKKKYFSAFTSDF